jgi:rod shape-determining protein MreB
MKMRGRDLINGLPKEITVHSTQINQAIIKTLKTIVDNIKTTLELTPPELVADIYERGIVLVGGGALLRGLDKYITQTTQIPVRIAEDPLTCAVRGTGLLLENEQLLKEIIVPLTADSSIGL